MGRSSFVTLLAFRGLVQGVLSLIGGVAFLTGLISSVVALSGGGLTAGFYGVAGFIVWYVAFWLRFEYDTAVLRRTPEGQQIHLIQ